MRTATLDQPEHGLTDAVLASTDVLTWWGHVGHGLVDDAVVARVHERVLLGMGLIVLHSGHHSKIFTRLMGTTCSLRWREAAEREVVWNVAPGHPITRGLPEVFTIPEQEMYGEFFDIPQPDELVFISSLPAARSSERLRVPPWTGADLLLQPRPRGHPVYHQAEVRRVIANAVRWVGGRPLPEYAFHGGAKSPTGWYL